MRNNPFIGALPIVARVLGDQYAVAVCIGGTRAYATPQQIVLPSLPADGERMKVRARGWLAHEAGHIRHTDFSVLGETPLETALVNCLEDIRIEARMAERFPGCRNHLARLRRLMVEEGDITPARDADHPAQVLQKYLLHRFNVEVLGRESLREIAGQTEQAFRVVFPGSLGTRLAALAGNVKALSSTGDSLELARALIGLLQDEAVKCEEHSDRPDPQGKPAGAGSSPPPDDRPQQDLPADVDTGGGDVPPCADSRQQPGESGAGSDTDPGNAGGNGIFDGDGQSGPPEADGRDARSRRPEQDREAGAHETPAPAGVCRGNARWALSAAQEDLEPDLSERVARRLEADSTTRDGSVVQMADVDETSMVVGSPVPEREVRRATVKLRTRLYGLMQATRLVHDHRRTCGVRFDRRGMHRPAAGDGRVFLARRERVEVNTAVFILLDRSGSMAGAGIDVAQRATLAIAMALESLRGVTVATAAFPVGPGPQTMRDIRYMTRFGQPVRARDYAIGADGYTPLAEALWRVGYEIVSRPETRRIVLTVTDGRPESALGTAGASARQAREVIARLSACGVAMLGLGIGTMAVEDLFPEHRVIRDIHQLHGAMFSMLEHRLLSGRVP